MKEIELPDGTIAEFPDGMPDVQIEAALKQHFQASAPSQGERFLQGQSDVGMGAAQTIASGARGAFPLISRAIELATTGRVGSIMEKPEADYRKRTEDYEARRKAAGETGFDWTRMGGAAASPWNVVSGRLGVAGHGASGASRIAHGAMAGAASGSMIPGTDAQRAFGAAAGGVLGGSIAGIPVLTAGARDLVTNFTKGGAEKKAGTILRDAAFNADDAITNLYRTQPVVPGSAPTTGMASGDEGVAALLNVVQDRVPGVKAAASRAATARETARTSFASKVGGTADDLASMQSVRDEVTKPMRDAVLSQVRPIPATNLTDPVQRLLKTPEMAGKVNQTALTTVLDDLTRITQPDGSIDPVALYAIRKDIGDMMSGKFSGDAGNMRFARKALKAVQNAIDDQIDGAASQKGIWKAYLTEYAGRSKAIDQMATFQDVIRRSGAGTINPDTGEPILFASKLNNILRREGADLAKKLTNDQMDALRRIASDLSAEQAAARASNSATRNSVTFGMLSGNSLLDEALGKTPGVGLLSRAAQWMKQGQQDRVLGLLGDAVHDPTFAARLLQASTPPANPPMRGLLVGPAAAVAGATVPPLLMGLP